MKDCIKLSLSRQSPISFELNRNSIQLISVLSKKNKPNEPGLQAYGLDWFCIKSVTVSLAPNGKKSIVQGSKKLYKRRGQPKKLFSDRNTQRRSCLKTSQKQKKTVERWREKIVV